MNFIDYGLTWEQAENTLRELNPDCLSGFREYMEGKTTGLMEGQTIVFYADFAFFVGSMVMQFN